MANHHERDIDYLISLENRVFWDIDPQVLREEHGAIVISCSDGRCFPDIFSHHTRIQRESNCRENPLIHPLPRHGGALVLAPRSPLVRRGSTLQEDLVLEIKEAMSWIKIKKIVLSSHYPCGKAASCHLSVEQSLRLLFNAEKAMKERLASRRPNISTYFHVDYGTDFRMFGKKKRVLSFFASHKDWDKLTT